jgi:hypothetical protein
VVVAAAAVDGIPVDYPLEEVVVFPVLRFRVLHLCTVLAQGHKFQVLHGQVLQCLEAIIFLRSIGYRLDLCLVANHPKCRLLSLGHLFLELSPILDRVFRPIEFLFRVLFCPAPLSQSNTAIQQGEMSPLGGNLVWLNGLFRMHGLVLPHTDGKRYGVILLPAINLRLKPLLILVLF